jgi:hypothetical protein
MKTLKLVVFGLLFWYVEHFGPPTEVVMLDCYKTLKDGPHSNRGIRRELAKEGKKYSWFRVLNALQALLDNGYVIQYVERSIVLYKQSDKSMPSN